ncbi:MAG: FecR domain-containing protein [Hyphomicrobiales bacterium]|nr:FecR domain-containing protein [Hyphomicrobiales bacterium]MCP5373176.1 FecR domain-containing protein [Hyphomicrobiales bacterium]
MDVLNFHAARNLRAGLAAALVAQAALAAVPAAAQQSIGTAVAVISDVRAEHGDKTRPLKPKSKVQYEDFVVTGGEASTQIMFLDETVISIGPGASLLLDAMVYDPGSKDGTFVVTVKKGLVRFASGVQPSQNYLIKTPTSSIGIRGTELDILVEDGGETSVMLRQGVITVTDAGGRAVELTTPGTFTNVGTGAAPSAPAPAPAALKNMGKSLTNPGQGNGLSAEWREAKAAWVADRKAVAAGLKADRAEAHDTSQSLQQAAKLARKAGGAAPAGLTAKDLSEVGAANAAGHGKGLDKEHGKGKGKGKGLSK